jgi:peptide deformylase
MALLPILRYPDPRLREKCASIDVFDESLRKLVADMSDTMYAANGAGLAAIQVGAPLRLFIVDPEVAGRSPHDPVLVFINPELVWISEEAQTARVQALDLEGKPFEIEGEELFGRALQHETDHLIGRLLIDLVGPVKREIIKRKMKKEALQADSSA